MSDLRTVKVRVELTCTYIIPHEVDFDEIREWLKESGHADEEINGYVVKDFLRADRFGFEVEGEDMNDTTFYDSYGPEIDEVDIGE